MAAKIQFICTNNITEYEACILGLKMTIDMNVHKLLSIGDSHSLIHQVQGEWAVKNPKIIPYVQIQNELADALSTIASMIKHPDTDYIDPLDIDMKEHKVHCSHVREEPDSLPLYFDIKKYLEFVNYLKDATSNQNKSIRRMALNFFLSGHVLYKRTTDLGILRCVDAVEASKIIEHIHAGVRGTHYAWAYFCKKDPSIWVLLNDYGE
nr:uncharacterized protein LOC101260336 [Solanum lycopersicum]